MSQAFPVRLVLCLKALFGCRTWHVEAAFVFALLCGAALLSGRGPIEWIGVFAIWFTFLQASVANRLEEMEAKRVETGRPGRRRVLPLEHALPRPQGDVLVFLLRAAWGVVRARRDRGLSCLYPVAPLLAPAPREVGV